jgi:4-amino-4-deoxy-L-arabinose transferase-like glycosyltransferase
MGMRTSPVTRNSARWPLVALIALTALRLIVAAAVPLVPDEAYYWVWSRALAPGYPDHPPMVAIWIRIGTALVGDSALGVRLLGPLAVAIASLLLMDAADRLLPGRRAGLRAAALLNATLLFGVGGVLMTPDAPLLMFWTACLWALARLLDSGRAWWWVVIGLFAGLAMASKYTAALLWFGIGAWLLAAPSMRGWLRRPTPWLGALLGLAIFSPVVLWESQHGWASFARQGGRIDAWQPAHAIRFLAELLLGQAGLITPLIFAFCIGGMIEALRETWRTRDPAWTLLAALTLPAVVLFTQHALGDRVQGNWPAIIYPAAGIAAGALCAPIWTRMMRPSVALGLAITLLIYLQAGSALLPVPAGVDPIARQLAGWDAFADQVDAVRRQAGADFVAADEYGVAAELARALPPGVTVIGVDTRWSLTDLPRAIPKGQIGVLVRSTRRSSQFDEAAWSHPVEIIQAARQRGNETVEAFRLYRVALAGNGADAVVLPRP